MFTRFEMVSKSNNISGKIGDVSFSETSFYENHVRLTWELINHFEKTYGVVVPDNFINDVLSIFRHSFIFPEDLVKIFKDKIDNTHILLDLKFPLVGTFHHYISEFNDKLRWYEYTSVPKYFDVVFAYLDLKNNEFHNNSVVEVTHYSKTSSKDIEIVFESSNESKCEEIADMLNNQKISIYDLESLAEGDDVCYVVTIDAQLEL